jgi:integrase
MTGWVRVWTGRSERTVRLNRDLLAPVSVSIGHIPLRVLTSSDVRKALQRVADSHSTRTVVLTHNALERAIRHAGANDHVRRNVATLIRPPQGQTGRPSKALTAEQTSELLDAATESWIGPYVILCLTMGVRTEEARALTWDHVDLDGDLEAVPPVPPHVEV